MRINDENTTQMMVFAVCLLEFCDCIVCDRLYFPVFIDAMRGFFVSESGELDAMLIFAQCLPAFADGMEFFLILSQCFSGGSDLPKRIVLLCDHNRRRQQSATAACVVAAITGVEQSISENDGGNKRSYNAV